VITSDDLALGQDYFRDRMRRHNRLLHGFGVVCGGLVCPVSRKETDGTATFLPWQVKVANGYVLGPYGDEILIDCERTVDLRTRGLSGITGEPCIDAPDPWCTPVYVAPAQQATLYVAVKYKQSMTRPIRVQPAGCGCDDAACEYSRWRDGYEIGVLTEMPACHDQPAPFNPCTKPPFLNLTEMCQSSGCPDCACGPWVLLAIVTVDPDGTIKNIDNCSHRRMAVSLSHLWWNCTPGTTRIDVKSKPVRVPAGGAPVTVTVTGTGLTTDAIYSFGENVVVSQIAETTGSHPGESMDLTVAALATAKAGIRPLRVVLRDCSILEAGDALKILPPKKMITGHGTIAMEQTVEPANNQPRKATKSKAISK
jgi:hypothetical protein